MIYLNNQYIDLDQAAISIRDRGFLLGDGLFETLRCEQGVPLFLEQHLERMNAGLECLHYPLRLKTTDTNIIIRTLLKKNHLEQQTASVRITVTRGEGPRGVSIAQCDQPTLLITAEEFHPANTALSLTVSIFTRNDTSPLSRFKTLDYLPSICAKQAALSNNFDDALLLNTKGEVVCTSVANIFWVKDTVLFTPDIACGALPGVMRAHVLRVASELAIQTSETRAGVDVLMAADEAFITNSLINIVSIKHLENKMFSQTAVTEKLHGATIT